MKTDTFRQWQQRWNDQGRCYKCPEHRPVTIYSGICDACAVRRRHLARQRFGWRQWEPGGRGQPPLDVRIGG